MREVGDDPRYSNRGESLGIVSLRDDGLVAQKVPVRGKGARREWEPRAGADK